MSNRIMTDAETLIIGLAYPASPQGRILSAWKYGALELVLEQATLEQLARILSQLTGEVGLKVFDICDVISGFRLGAQVLGPETAPWTPGRNGRPGALQMGAAYYVSEDEGLRRLGPDVPLLAPEYFCADLD